MLLSDIDIRAYIATGDIYIMPFPQDSAFQSASIDVHLGDHILVLDLKASLPGNLQWIDTKLQRTPIYLEPQEFILAPLLEHISISNRVAASIHGKSSIGRMGISVHCTAGYIDPGWNGILTLEISNVSPVPAPIFAGMAIAQLRFDLLSQPCVRAYGHPHLESHYQYSTTAKGTKF